MKPLTIIFLLLYTAVTHAQISTRPLPSGYSSNCTVAENKVVLVKADVPPVFPGGKKICPAYFNQRFNRRQVIEKGAQPGLYKIAIRLIVQADGSYCDIMPESSNGFGIEEEAIRILLQTPRWKPAKQRGKPADAYYHLTVTVKI